MLDTKPRLIETDFPAVQRQSIETLQVNMGYLCNLSCTHCHVNAGPNRTELITEKTLNQVIQLLDLFPIKTVDLTGGAPELSPLFRQFVRILSERGIRIIDRCNLTVLLEADQEDTVEFLASHSVEVVASLPCYTEENVNQQRGKGVFTDSITALKQLNVAGYGIDPRLVLNLVYNPTGPFLPPSQDQLQQDYKSRLMSDFGIRFNELLTITNMPISRFGAVLLSKGQFDDYMSLLKTNFSEANMTGLMCRSLLSIDWQGNVYDCDFNQMLEWSALKNQSKFKNRDKVITSDQPALHISEILERPDSLSSMIRTGDHCYGCTAGQGSSCGGALA